MRTIQIAPVSARFGCNCKDIRDYVETLTEAALEENPIEIPSPRWQVLLHIINHGTDHRSTVLQRLTEFGVPTF